MNFEDDDPFQIIYLSDNAINNAKETKTITLPHQGIAPRPTISSDLRKNEANAIPDANNHSLPQSPIVSNKIRPGSEETSLNKSLAARRPQYELIPSRQLQELQEYLSRPSAYNVNTDTWIPKTYREAMKKANLWWEPMAKEIKMLKQQNVFTIVPRPVVKMLLGQSGCLLSSGRKMGE